MPRCKHEGNKFVAKLFNQKFCMETEECRDAAIKFVLDNNRRLAEKKKDKEWQDEKKVILDKLKTMGDYEKDLQTEINLMCRLIDEGCNCISGGHVGKFSAGHYHSRGKNTTLRFNLHNVHQQCFQCNSMLSGNITHYNLGLISWYGKEYQDYVEYKMPLEYPLLKWTKNDLILWTAQARTYKKELMKLEKPLSVEDRLFWRNHYNEKLGIYKIIQS